jgi:2-phospho-L-lactate guanylyltransferase
MHGWIVIPIKAPEACKTRLRAVLGDVARRNLVRDMLAHVVSAARAAATPDHTVMLLGPDRHGLSESLPSLPDSGAELNAVLTLTLRAAMRAKVDRVTIISADLPTIKPAELAELVDLSTKNVVIAPDLAERGTNALSIPLPAGEAFRFRYGENSFTAHRAVAAHFGLPVTVIQRPGLQFDVDEPQDLLRLGMPFANNEINAPNRFAASEVRPELWN